MKNIRDIIQAALDKDDLDNSKARAKAEKMMGSNYDNFTKIEKDAWHFVYENAEPSKELLLYLKYKPNKHLLKAIKKVRVI